MNTLMPHRYKVLVLGAGINGLASAVRIQETCPNVDVTIIADRFTTETTSSGAAGFWEVFACAKEDEALTTQMSRETYNHIKELASSELGPVAGTFRITGFQLQTVPMQEEYVFKDIVEGYRKLTPEEFDQFRDSRIKDGRQFTSMICEPIPYMKWLTNRFIGNGGQFIKKKINSLSELSDKWDVVVNCTGLGSYQLLNDHEMIPIRGQVMRVHAPWIKHFYGFEIYDDSGHEVEATVYLLPNRNEIVVGGTFQRGNWNTAFSEADSEMIWKRAVDFIPSLKHAKVLKSWVGLRPGRSRLRLEPEIIDIKEQQRKIRMVHNYGHGGAGLSIFYGCARKVTEMVTDFIQDIQRNAIATKSKL